MKKIFAVLLALALGLTLRAQSGGAQPFEFGKVVAKNYNITKSEGADDVFIPIVKYLSGGDVEKLSAWFAPYLDVELIGKGSPVSALQAKSMLTDFFRSHVPDVISLDHTATKGSAKYAALKMKCAAGEVYFLSMYLSLDSEKQSYYLKQIKITR